MWGSLTCHTTRNSSRLALVLLAGLLVLSSGCGSSSSSPTVRATDSRLRFVNTGTSGATDAYVVARSTAGNADIAGLAPTFAGVGEGTSSAFRVLAPAVLEVIVTPAGSKTEIGRGEVILTAGLDFSAILVQNGSGAPTLQFTQQTR